MWDMWVWRCSDNGDADEEDSGCMRQTEIHDEMGTKMNDGMRGSGERK